MRSVIVYFLICLGLCSVVHSWKFFHKGRKVGGNLGLPDQEHAGKKIPEEWFDQLLDHFSPGDVTTWKQRFYVNDEYYNGKGPVFKFRVKKYKSLRKYF